MGLLDCVFETNFVEEKIVLGIKNSITCLIYECFYLYPVEFLIIVARSVDSNLRFIDKIGSQVIQ